jgi:hypothetical protein
MSYPAPTLADTGLYSRVQQFYAEQMQLLDLGAAQEWADTFTEDGVFAANGQPAPVRGRAAITAAVHATNERLAKEGVAHRHWLGMLTVRPQSDGTLKTRSYALVLEVPRGGDARIHRSTVCEDVLVPIDDSWQVRHRAVTRDDLA